MDAVVAPLPVARPAAQRLSLAPEAMPAGHGWLPSLDGLRAGSIALVLIAHLVSDRLAPGGFGVAVFFVISGFLIARLLLAEARDHGRVALGRFYLRRMLRLYPALLAYVAIVTTTYLVLGHPVGWAEVAAALGYVANYLYVWLDAHAAPARMPFSVFWSLALEEHFYLLFPALLVMLRGRPARLVWAMAALCAGALGWRVWLLHGHPAWANPFSPLYYRTDARLDSIGWGVLMAAACETARGRRWLIILGRPLPALAAVLVLLLTFAVRDEGFRQTWRYTLQGAALVVLMGAVLFQRWPEPVQRLLNWAPVAWVGRLSYSLYLWHLACPEIARTLAPGAPLPAQWALRFALAFALAAASYYALEVPLLRWRRRLGSDARTAPARA